MDEQCSGLGTHLRAPTKREQADLSTIPDNVKYEPSNVAELLLKPVFFAHGCVDVVIKSSGCIRCRVVRDQLEGGR